MKILIVSIYDYSYNLSAAEFDGKQLTKIELTDRQYEAIHRYPWLDENVEEIKKLFEKYDKIIKCEDGDIEDLSSFVVKAEDTPIIPLDVNGPRFDY